MVDFDWENARGDATGDGWAQAKPMDCGERMTKQVDMQLAAFPKSKSKYMVCTPGYTLCTFVMICVQKLPK